MESNANAKPKEFTIQIRGENAILSGTYANHMLVHMTREEFVLDCINVIPPHATLNARVVIVPTHLKRMLTTLQESLNRYEKEFGALPTNPPSPPKADFFQ